MSIIVTGATGHFGALATKFLLERIPASDLILATRKPDSLACYAEKGVRVRFADFDQPESLPAAFAGGERMLLISTKSVGRRAEQHARAIRAAQSAGVRHIVYTSYVGVGPSNPALVSPDHYLTEECLKSCGVAYTILRDNLYAEAFATGIGPRVLSLGYWVCSTIPGRVGWVAREDCAAAAAVVLATPGHEGRTYNLTGPELLSFCDVAAMARELTHRPIDLRVVSDEAVDADLATLGVPKRYAEGMRISGMHSVEDSCRDDIVSMERSIREGYLAMITDDVRYLLGRAPRSLRDVCLAQDCFRADASLGQPHT